MALVKNVDIRHFNTLRRSRTPTDCKGPRICDPSAPAADDSLLTQRSKNLLVNPGFEHHSDWTFSPDNVTLDTSVARNGARALRFSNQRIDESAFARQVITLDPPIMHPIRISGWSRAENVELGQDYDIYLDLEYDDGTPLWGMIAHFTPGSHDWEHANLVFDVAKPVKKIEVFVLFPVIREYFGMVKQRYPEIKTFTTAKVPQDPEVMRDLNVDWNCPLTSVYDFEEAERCRQAGLQVWAYVCMGPGYPYANWLADHPLIEGRVIWWQAYHQQMDGLLYWGVNIWSRENNHRPIDPSQGPLLDWSITTGGQHDRLHGDGVLVYPGVAGPIGSIRLANIRDGLEDYEYLWLLGERTGRAEATQRALENATDSLTNFTRDPDTLYDQRESIARMLGR